MSEIVQAIDGLPTGGMTVALMRGLDYVVPGEWNESIEKEGA